MLRKTAFFLITLPLHAMEVELAVNPIKEGASYGQQAEFMVDLYFKEDAHALKPRIVPKLTRKLEESPQKDSLSLIELPKKREHPMTPKEMAVLEFADKLLATTLHEILAEKEVEALAEARKKKYAMMAAVAGGIGTLGTALIALLTHIIGAGCLDCVDECLNATQTGSM